MKSSAPVEKHYSQRIGWLRAAVLGANDGILSTSSLVVGVAAAGSSRTAVLVAGVAGLMAGAMSMAAGEYVSVSSQADTENADLERERRELRESPERERQELRGIYIERGLDAELATRVAEQLMAKDALRAHGATRAARQRDGDSHQSSADVAAGGTGGRCIGGAAKGRAAHAGERACVSGLNAAVSRVRLLAHPPRG